MQKALTIRLTGVGCVTGKGIKEQTLSILLTTIFILQILGMKFFIIQVIIKYLSTLEIMHKLEY
jgi:hypothetical protein